MSDTDEIVEHKKHYEKHGKQRLLKRKILRHYLMVKR